jgi:hypothetical protein
MILPKKHSEYFPTELNFGTQEKLGKSSFCILRSMKQVKYSMELSEITTSLFFYICHHLFIRKRETCHILF